MQCAALVSYVHIVKACCDWLAVWYHGNETEFMRQ